MQNWVSLYLWQQYVTHALCQYFEVGDALEGKWILISTDIAEFDMEPPQIIA